MIEIKDEDMLKDMAVFKNLSQDVIIITSDKVELLLNEHHNIVKRKTEWLTPLGIFITILLTLLTTNFDKTFLSLNKDVWKAIFILSSVVTGGYTIYLICVAIYYRDKGTIGGFMGKLKKQSQNLSPNNDQSQVRELSIKYMSWGEHPWNARLQDLTCNWANTTLLSVSDPEFIHWQTQPHNSPNVNYTSEAGVQCSVFCKSHLHANGEISFTFEPFENGIRDTNDSSKIRFLDWNKKVQEVSISPMKIVDTNSNKTPIFVFHSMGS